MKTEKSLLKLNGPSGLIHKPWTQFDVMTAYFMTRGIQLIYVCRADGRILGLDCAQKY
jgi:hypothetical protein